MIHYIWWKNSLQHTPRKVGSKLCLVSVKDRKAAFHGQPTTAIVTRVANPKVSVRLSLPVCRCVFTKVKLKMFSIEERIFLVENVFREGGKYTEKVKQKFTEQFPNSNYHFRILSRIMRLVLYIRINSV